MQSKQCCQLLEMIKSELWEVINVQKFSFSIFSLEISKLLVT